MTDEVPPVVECPCGGGHAERLSSSISEPYRKNAKRRIQTFFYRHRGCPIGGSIVLLDGEVLRTVSPLFHPKRYNALATRDVAVPTATALADGGEPLE